MKGYRTPSWFRMKGFTHKKQAKQGRGKPAGGMRSAAKKQHGS